MPRSPAVIIYDASGVAMAVQDGVALPANTRGFLSVGFDGTNARFVRIDSNGHQYVLSNQLPSSLVGGRLDVVVGAPLPAGTNNIGDVDVLTVPVPLSTTGGGTEAESLRVTIANNSTGLLSVDDNDGSLTIDTLQLPTSLVGGRLDTNIGSWFGATSPTVGQKAMSASLPVVVASDQTAIPVSQHSPPWAVEGTDANGGAPTENPVLIAGWDSTNVRILLTEADGTARTKNNFIDDRDKIVGVNFAKTLVAATTYYEFVDLDGSNYKHNTSGTALLVASSGGWAAKTNSGSKWNVQLAVILAIDGTSADLGVLPLFSISLGNTSQFSDKQFQNLFPGVVNLAVSSGDFTYIADGYKETGVTAINTGITLSDVFGSSVTPAVGDLLLRVELVSGVGTLDFAYGLQYWAE